MVTFPVSIRLYSQTTGGNPNDLNLVLIIGGGTSVESKSERVSFIGGGGSQIFLTNKETTSFSLFGLNKLSILD
jgi:hypothetical protein